LLDEIRDPVRLPRDGVLPEAGGRARRSRRGGGHAQMVVGGGFPDAKTRARRPPPALHEGAPWGGATQHCGQGDNEMIRSGQTIENPVTGEVLIFHQTSRDTGGEYVLVETILRPGATVAAAHSHPYQAETFHVLEGRVGFKVGGKKVELRAGDGVTVLPRTAH